jgi:hypothetical protein
MLDSRNLSPYRDINLEGTTESSGILNIRITEDMRMVAGEKSGSKATHTETLLELNLKDVDIPDDYIQAKLQASMDNFGELRGVKIMQIGATGDYELTEDYTYAADEYSITALKGFKYDRASIPRIFWVIISKDDLSNTPPLFHDFLYANGGVLPKPQITPYRTFQRQEADMLFLELMKKSGVAWWRCVLAYKAVRQFSEFAWKTRIL